MSEPTQVIPREDLISDLYVLYPLSASNGEWYLSWLNSQTDIQLAEHWKAAYQ